MVPGPLALKFRERAAYTRGAVRLVRRIFKRLLSSFALLSSSAREPLRGNRLVTQLWPRLLRSLIHAAWHRGLVSGSDRLGVAAAAGASLCSVCWFVSVVSDPLFSRAEAVSCDGVSTFRLAFLLAGEDEEGFVCEEPSLGG